MKEAPPQKSNPKKFSISLPQDQSAFVYAETPTPGGKVSGTFQRFIAELQWFRRKYPNAKFPVR